MQVSPEDNHGKELKIKLGSANPFVVGEKCCKKLGGECSGT
jgi:hypothetical protein